MDNWRDEIAMLRDEIAILQARMGVQHMALQALVQSHARPDAVLQQWRQLRADNVAAAYALPTDVRASDWLSQYVHAFAEDWTAELVDAVTRNAERLQGSPANPDVTASSAS